MLTNVIKFTNSTRIQSLTNFTHQHKEILVLLTDLLGRRNLRVGDTESLHADCRPHIGHHGSISWSSAEQKGLQFPRTSRLLQHSIHRMKFPCAWTLLLVLTDTSVELKQFSWNSICLSSAVSLASGGSYLCMSWCCQYALTFCLFFI